MFQFRGRRLPFISSEKEDTVVPGPLALSEESVGVSQNYFIGFNNFFIEADKLFFFLRKGRDDAFRSPNALGGQNDFLSGCRRFPLDIIDGRNSVHELRAQTYRLEAIKVAAAPSYRQT